MIKKEIIKRAIHFDFPERIGLRYAFDQDRSDIAHVGFKAGADWRPTRDNEDEWGCIWDTLGGSIVTSFGQVVGHPIADWDDYPDYKFPDPYAPGRFDGIAEVIENYSDHYIAAGMDISGFNRLTFLRGYDCLLEDLYLNRDKLEELADRYFEFEMEIIKGYSQFDIDGIWFADDWGMQNTLMISPDMWRDFFKPRYKMQFDLVNSLGMDVIFHSCGYVRDIIPDLIEIGVDAFNLNQPRLLDIDELANRFRGATCFICPVDMQTTMIKGTSEDIWREAEELVQKLGSAEGGFIACCDEGIDHGYVPMDNIREMGKAFEEYAFLAHTPAD